MSLIPVERPPEAGETLSVEEAARRLGIGRSLAYELARRDELGVPVVRLGRRFIVPRRPLDRLLGVEERAA
jgi:excisionase family DNA binding protein